MQGGGLNKALGFGIVAMGGALGGSVLPSPGLAHDDMQGQLDIGIVSVLDNHHRVTVVDWHCADGIVTYAEFKQNNDGVVRRAFAPCGGTTTIPTGEIYAFRKCGEKAEVDSCRDWIEP